MTTGWQVYTRILDTDTSPYRLMDIDERVGRIRMFGWTLVAVVATLPATAFAQTSNGGEAKERPLPAWTDFLDAFLELNVGEIAVWRIGVALVLVILGISLRKFLLSRMLRPVEALLEHTETEYDDKLLGAVQRPLRWIVNLVAIYLAILVLALPSELTRVATLILKTIGTVMVAWMANKMVDVFLALLLDYARGTESEVDDYLAPVVGRVVRVSLFVFVFIVIVQQWGYNVTSLLAGLGIGGLAFALAAKPTLSNWFGSLMIFTDRPFTIGDRIDIDAGNGVVEEVGLRSTRIRTREDSLITIPNASIAGGPIENLSARRERLIQTTFGVVYRTTAEQLRDIVSGVRGILSDHDDIGNDHVIVRFAGFGDSALEVFIECYAQTTSRGEYYRIREEIQFQIADLVEEVGSEFAFPSRSIYVETPVSEST